MRLEEAVADAFGIGVPEGPLVPAALGWGGHNTVYRLVTGAGVLRPS